ncbi:MAG TPA: HigA family addiction module antitoxin [Planctomycetaceae bacterium]|jgi:HTH-type transcriptional regulator/antitoxin HigA|nr:HigA family addiction module antitoxin [Planctomycetaceae bacterium]
MTNRVSVEPFPPAGFIQKAMDAHGWTQDDLAQVMGRNRQTVMRLLNAQTSITPETAHELAQAFETSPEVWMNLQMSYELALAAKEDRDIERRAKIYQKVPVRDVIKRHWIPDERATSELEANVCKLLGVSSLDESPRFAMAARKSTSYDYDTPAQVAWFARASQLAYAAPATTYDPGVFGTAMAELRKLAAEPEDLRKVPKLLADFGIRLLLIERLPKSKVDGVAFWINEDESPVIALSLRYDRIDNVWHTLIHEMIHIKYHDQTKVDVDLSVSGSGTDATDIENRANTEASEFLVPYEKLQSFVARHGRISSQVEIVRAAKVQRVHPGIFVGQMHGRGFIDFRYYRKLLVPIRSEIVGQALTDGWGNVPVIGD